MSRIDLARRRAGVLMPLSSLRSERDFGVGDFAALPPFFSWMKKARLSVWNLLPLNDLAPKDSCPYSSLSAFAIDPVYADLRSIPELRDSKSLAAELAKEAASAEVQKLRTAKRVDFARVRALKMRWLERAYRAFAAGARPSRNAALEIFRRRQRHWLADYALYRALSEENGWSSWKTWPKELKERCPEALGEARKRLADRMRFHSFVQWTLLDQWRKIRIEAARYGVLLYGDIPFGLNTRSADVWARQNEFDFSATMGAPPDWYSADGQAWGLPAYRWERMEREGHLWWRARVRQAGSLYDLFRLDHAVGFFRTWLIRPDKKKNAFDISGAKAQEERGRRFFKMCVKEGRLSKPIAEDLGVIPDFVPKVLSELRVPGYIITRWERKDGVYRPSSAYPELSVAVTGNHDTDTLAVWWSTAPQSEREGFWRWAGQTGPAPRFSARVHEALLAGVYRAKSALVILPFQDLTATRERVNVPGTVRNSNWTYRARWTVEELDLGRAKAKTGLLAKLAEDSGRA